MSKIKDKPDGTGRSKKILLIGIGAGLLTAGGAAGGVYLTGGVTNKQAVEDPHRPKLVERSDEPAEPVVEGEEGKVPMKEGTVTVKNDRVKVDPKKFEITYVALEQSFTANLADGAGFVQIGISLATYYDEQVVRNIERQAVPIRSAVLMVLSQQDAAVLSTPQGKQMLQRDLTNAINDVLRQKEGFGGIENVYFVNLVIQ